MLRSQRVSVAVRSSASPSTRMKSNLEDRAVILSRLLDFSRGAPSLPHARSPRNFQARERSGGGELTAAITRLRSIARRARDRARGGQRHGSHRRGTTNDADGWRGGYCCSSDGACGGKNVSSSVSRQCKSGPSCSPLWYLRREALVSAQHPCSSDTNQGIGSPAGADRLSNRGRGSPSEVRHAEMWK
jgi:hypothetical protein